MTTAFSLADGLGLAFRHLDEGKLGEAKRMARRIEKAMPSLPGLAYLLGLIAAAEHDDARAARHFVRAIEETPGAPAPLVAMARAQARQGRDADAARWYRQAIEATGDAAIKDEFARHLLGRGVALHEAGRTADALALFEEAAALDPGSVTAAWLLAETRDKAGDRDGAIAMYRRAAALDPSDKYGAALMLARLGAGEAPSQASPAFVRGLFDQYADRFDDVLVARLGYRAPALLLDAIRATLGDGPFDAFDAGCGTGLMGAALKPFARRLDGCDLSPRMVEQARARNIYDAVETGEVGATLAARPAAYDLITAADVLVYLGDLAPIFAAVTRALRPGGGFAFTVERAEGDGWALGESGRYAHSDSYLRRIAAEAGLTVATLSLASTRNDRGAPVPGLLAVLRKAA